MKDVGVWVDIEQVDKARGAIGSPSRSNQGSGGDRNNSSFTLLLRGITHATVLRRLEMQYSKFGRRRNQFP